MGLVTSHMIQLAQIWGGSISKSKPQYGKLRSALFWHPYEKAGFLKRRYVDNSPTKGAGGGTARGKREKPQDQADLSAKASDENRSGNA